MDSIKELLVVTDTPFLFPDPIVVKITPHIELFRCYGIFISKDGTLKTLNINQEWQQIEPNQVNAGYILQTIFQRIKSMKLRNAFT